jgi:ribosomal-protein-alanine N-acetyltransferase
MKIVLETPRLILREFVPEDVEALVKVICDPETMKYYPVTFGCAGAVEWIARNRRRYQTDGFGLWAMVLKQAGELVGDCGLTPQDVNGTSEIEIGYHVRRDLWGQGLATEAAQACREYGFANPGVERLISLIRPENLQSRRVAEKNGMKVVGEVMWRGLLHCVYAIERPHSTFRGPSRCVPLITPRNEESACATEKTADPSLPLG